MNLDGYNKLFQPVIEHDLESVISEYLDDQYSDLRHMLRYHLGWEGEGAGIEAQGKRIRPVLVLLCCAASGGDWKSALPAASAVELIHNFSLIHDDIQDNSLLRRGRPTIWSKWGIAQAINAGDLMYTLAYLSLVRINKVGPQIAVEANHVLSTGCARLTQGQFLDLHYETQEQVSLEDYYRMVEGKTAALLSVCTELGSLIAKVNNERRVAFRQFGYYLGMAFQVVDDWLGIWGETNLTGKSNESDLVSKKKTLPVIYLLKKCPEFYGSWKDQILSQADIPEIIDLMDRHQVKDYTQSEADRLTYLALKALEEAVPNNETSIVLRSLTEKLLTRKK